VDRIWCRRRDKRRSARLAEASASARNDSEPFAIGHSRERGHAFGLSGAELDRCVEIARRHIALAAPKRLILFGDGPSRAFLGGPVTQRRGKIHKVEGARTIATFAPRWLLQRPADKALAWRDLLLLMEE